jgi:UDP-N-acetyl-D-glucosamine dehydrogenase
VPNNSNQTLAIIGQGYVGLPLAMAAVASGWNVIGIDKVETKVNQINQGFSPVEDVSDAQLQSALESGAYQATTNFSAVSAASVITICVPTPLDRKREPDLSLLQAAVTGVAPFIADKTLLISESTSYPGTLRDVIIPTVNKLKKEKDFVIFFASAPERVNPGDLIWNQKNTPRLVGSIDEESQGRAFEFYTSICDAVVLVDSPEIAEAAKLLENTFRLVNIALVNEFAQLCFGAGISVQDVLDAAATKPYGFIPFRPGVGVGGHCIPVDPLYLTWWARQVGSRATIVESADVINFDMPKFIAERALGLLPTDLPNPRVLILGVAYKPGVSDTRETPVSELRRNLESRGAIVEWHDPLVSVWENSKPVGLDWNCDVAILATKQEGIHLSPLLSNGIPVLDCTNSFRLMHGVTSL